MYHTIDEFLSEWSVETELTLKVLRNITDESLSNPVVGYRRTVGTLAWHITGSISEMMKTSGYPINSTEENEPEPVSAAKISEVYQTAAKSLYEKIKSEWNDESLSEKVNMYGEMWTKEFVLRVLIIHQAHHRAQLTVLMRINGLKVPGIYGPSYEEWIEYNMEPHK